jgi:hypothetical protein
MRLHPIVWELSRVAARDDAIPLASPIATKSGEQISVIPVRKGTHIDMSFCSYHRWVAVRCRPAVSLKCDIRLPEVWGEDADEWNPRRFRHVDKEKQISVGLYANL